MSTCGGKGFMLEHSAEDARSVYTESDERYWALYARGAIIALYVHLSFILLFYVIGANLLAGKRNGKDRHVIAAASSVTYPAPGNYQPE